LKVKCSLWKVTNSLPKASKISSPATKIRDYPEVQNEKPQQTAHEVLVYPEIQEPQNGNLLENAKSIPWYLITQELVTTLTEIGYSYLVTTQEIVYGWELTVVATVAEITHQQKK
jgi:hypothetical protein